MDAVNPIYSLALNFFILPTDAGSMAFSLDAIDIAVVVVYFVVVMVVGIWVSSASKHTLQIICHISHYINSILNLKMYLFIYFPTGSRARVLMMMKQNGNLRSASSPE